MNKNLAVIVFIGAALSACSGEKSDVYKAKSAFTDSCVRQESASRPAEQAQSYCDCVADSVFSNGDVSDETKKLMPTMNDKNSRLYNQKDAAKVRGALMSCYTAKFYKK